MKKVFLSFIFLGLLIGNLFSQTVADGFRYQTTLRNSSGNIIASQSVLVRFSFYSNSPTGILQWQENHSVVTDAFGAVVIIAGTGSSTGAGVASAFSTIDWSGSQFYLKISIDLSGLGTYIDMGTSQLFSVPYSFYSTKTSGSNNVALSQFNDVNLSGISFNKLLKWDGAYWIPSADNDSDTVLFAYNAGHSNSSDTSFYSYGATPDTVLFSYQSGSSAYSLFSGNSTNSYSSSDADTANYALASAPAAWVLTGNTLTDFSKFIGSNDTSSVRIRTNNIERVSLRSNKLYIGNSINSADFNLKGNDGIVAIGTFGAGSLSVSGAGTRMYWFPGKGAFRAGSVSGNQWDLSVIGANSIAVGYNTKAGVNSFCSGYNSEAVDYSFAIGNNSNAMGVGAYPGGNSIAMGDSCFSSSTRAITIGRGNVSSFSTCIAIGRNNVASGSVSVALGVNCISNGNDSYVIGYHGSANSKNGAFVYADASSPSVTSASVINQFIVRASGGIIFYSDSARTMGVSIAPGSGSWASVSDVSKKENFADVKDEELLKKIQELRITSWSYKSQSKYVRHIGPMAQDFYKAFYLGESKKMITGVDIDGVILCGIKAINNRVGLLESAYETDLLNGKTSQIETDFLQLNNRLDKIEGIVVDEK